MRGQRLEVRGQGSPTARGGFTLTELLVVIAIIAVLAALGTFAAVKALNTMKRTRITTEANQLGQSLEDFKTKYGAYPPNAINDGSNSSISQINSDLVRMFKKAFPRSKENPDVVYAIAGGSPGGSITSLANGINADEALYFWLGGFSDDPEYPLSGTGGPSFDVSQGEILENRNGKNGYGFDRTLLGPRNASGQYDTSTNRFVTYPDPRNSNVTRQINFWQYFPKGSKRPLVYFDCSRYKPAKYDPPFVSKTITGEPWVYALKKFREGVTSSTLANDLAFANGGKFQVLHCGLDDAWGKTYLGTASNPPLFVTDATLSQYLLFPTGPFTGDTADTLTNFTTGALADEQPK